MEISSHEDLGSHGNHFRTLYVLSNGQRVVTRCDVLYPSFMQRIESDLRQLRKYGVVEKDFWEYASLLKMS